MRRRLNNWSGKSTTWKTWSTNSSSNDGRGLEHKNINQGACMQISGIPFGVTDWSKIAPSEHKGERGAAYWRTQQFGEIRVRMVEYTSGYLADHWCLKGHVLLCLEGEL